MKIRADFKPDLRMTPTKESLDMAVEIAQAIGAPASRESIAEQAKTLHADMLRAILNCVDTPVRNVDLRAGVYSEASMFAAHTNDGQTMIGVDEAFEYLCFSLAHLGAAYAFSNPSPAQEQEIIATAHEVLSIIQDNKRFFDVRDADQPFVYEYSDCLNLSGAVARAMLVFILCHEIAHIEAGDLDKPASKDMELQADKRGAELFLQVFDRPKRTHASEIYIDPKIAAAPLVLNSILHLFERWRIAHGLCPYSKAHPTAEERLSALEPLFEGRLSKMAQDIKDGFNYAFWRFGEAFED